MNFDVFALFLWLALRSISKIAALSPITVMEIESFVCLLFSFLSPARASV